MRKSEGHSGAEDSGGRGGQTDGAIVRRSEAGGGWGVVLQRSGRI